MKKINWKIMNYAFWTEIILSYSLPFHVLDDFQYKVGFPISFLTIYNGKMGISPFTSVHLDPLALLINGIIIYFLIKLGIKVCSKIRRRVF